MTIELIAHDKKRFLPLLLLADEQESMIDRYLERGDLYVMHDDDSTPVAVAVVTLEGEGTCELKNLAVKPEAQRQGIGNRLLGYLCRRYAKSCHTMLIGTGDTPQTTSFYRQNGFTYSHAVPDFFTANYDHPIIENGILLRDMLYFRKPLASPASCILRPATVEDLPALRALFHDTVLTVNLQDYTPEEVADWASCGDDIARTPPFVTTATCTPSSCTKTTRAKASPLPSSPPWRTTPAGTASRKSPPKSASPPAPSLSGAATKS